METLESSISPRRATLLARLAAERSFLLQQLEGVGEAALAHGPVYDGWLLPAMLGHIAYWDAFAADRLAKLADGRRDDIQLLGVGEDTLDARNAALRQRFAVLPFAQAVAMCQKERRSLLLALSRLSDDALFRRVRLRPGWQATPASWAGAPYVHDAQHSADLARWRANYPPNDPALRVIHRALLRPLLGLSRAEFLAVAALIPPAAREMQPIEGEWTLKQVLGHLSDYERLGVVALRQVAAGREPALRAHHRGIRGVQRRARAGVGRPALGRGMGAVRRCAAGAAGSGLVVGRRGAGPAIPRSLAEHDDRWRLSAGHGRPRAGARRRAAAGAGPAHAAPPSQPGRCMSRSAGGRFRSQ